MGIRKKIIFGFSLLALLLLFAGLVSTAELKRMRNQADNIIAFNNGVTDAADLMQRALDRQNDCIVRMVMSNGDQLDDEFRIASQDFDGAVSKADTITGASIDLSVIMVASEHYRNIVSARINELSYFVFREESAESHSAWFISTYLDAYDGLDTAIKEFAASPHTSMTHETDELVNSTMRTFTPIIITLMVAIIIVMIFCSFIDIYYIRPILAINAGLKGYVNNRVPYNAGIDNTGDEIGSLDSFIKELTDRNKELQK